MRIWHELESAAPERRVVLSAEPHYLIGGEKAALHVQGVVNGKVPVFVVRDYREHERATLFVYGGVTSGTLSATEPHYATSLDFDERLEKMRPPRFPLTDRYEVAAWDGRWTEDPEGAP